MSEFLGFDYMCGGPSFLEILIGAANLNDQRDTCVSKKMIFTINKVKTIEEGEEDNVRASHDV